MGRDLTLDHVDEDRSVMPSASRRSAGIAVLRTDDHLEDSGAATMRPPAPGVSLHDEDEPDLDCVVLRLHLFAKKGGGLEVVRGRLRTHQGA